MLCKLIMEIKGSNLNFNMGSLFHGYLMKSIDPAFAEYFHYNTTNSFTSCIFKDNKSGKHFWKITTFNQKSYDILIKKLLDEKNEKVYIEHKNMDVYIKSYDFEESSFEKLFFSEQMCKRIRFLTPTSFKSNQVTHIFPNLQVLLRGVINKINEHSDTVRLADENIIQELLEKVYIRDYNLKTNVFNLEGIKIKGFIGTVDLSLRGEKHLLQILNFLILCSEYTGFGIKTSIGMGAVKPEI